MYNALFLVILQNDENQLLHNVRFQTIFKTFSNSINIFNESVVIAMI